jgi:hypothetical protein
MIGDCANKVAKALQLFDRIHGADSVELARRVEALEAANRGCRCSYRST